MLLKVSVLVIYILIPCVKVCEGKDINASYSQLATPWIRAKEQCIPLGSKTTFNVSNDKVIVKSTSNEVFWIGAYAEYTKWTKILGCYKVTTVVSASVVNNTALETHDVKSCIEYCEGSTYFGLTNDRCICYGDSFTLANIGRCLPQRCSGSGQDFCGGPGEAIVYKTVPDQFSGVGECMASGYKGEYNYTGAQFHLFNQAVALPCDNKELGYIYRSVLGFPQSHHLFVYTLPVDSWQDAVLGSYKTAVGILEFVNFLLAKQSLATPMVGDKYWVGLFRRHQVKFGSELPLSGDASCVAGKININGTLTTELRSCTDQLRVLCEHDGGDVTDDATTSSTVTVQSGNNNETKTNHKITNLGILEDSEQFLGTTIWYIVLGVLSFLLLVVILITIVWSLKLKKRKANLPVESTPNNYTDFRSMLERNTNRENATSPREELYLTIPEQEMAADPMENRPRLPLPERGLSSEFHGARPFNENKYNEIEGEYSDIKDGIQGSNGSLSAGLLSEAYRADDGTADGQYFLLEKNLNDFDQEKSNKSSGVKGGDNVSDLYYEVENVDTGLGTVIYHGLEKEGENSTNIDGDLGIPDVINSVYHELERPKDTSKLNLSKKVSFSQNTADLVNRKNLIYEKVWDNGYKQHKTKSMKTRTGDDRQTHNRLKSCVSAPLTKSTRPKKSLKLRKKDSERDETRNRVRISGLPEVSAPRDSTYDMLKHSTKVSGARAPKAGLEDYDTMASVRAFIEQPPSSSEN